MIMEDELFSNVTWDKDSRWSGIMTLADGRTAAFEIDGDEPLEAITEAARNTLEFLIKNEPLIRHKIAASMCELYKDWNDGNTITPEELAQRINLDSVTIFDEGGGNLLYEPEGDLFTDHWIQVWMDANGEIDEPGLEG
jgi:hypothetical protein